MFACHRIGHAVTFDIWQDNRTSLHRHSHRRRSAISNAVYSHCVSVCICNIHTSSPLCPRTWVLHRLGQDSPATYAPRTARHHLTDNHQRLNHLGKHKFIKAGTRVLLYLLLAASMVDRRPSTALLLHDNAVIHKISRTEGVRYDYMRCDEVDMRAHTFGGGACSRTIYRHLSHRK